MTEPTDADKAKAAELVYGTGAKMKEILPGVFVPEGAEWSAGDARKARITVNRDDIKNWVGSKGQ